ncbi:MAG: hypothetical protein NW237_05810 [Cyanobacteriota bacterium]|nr:hypothetical protein [Cyanobacteriota bacterium]
MVRQISLLQEQVDRLHLTLTQLPEQIAATLLANQESKPPLSNRTHHRYSHQMAEEGHSFLLDEDLPNVGSRNMSHDIAPEAQIQRLTAQLTAAYNRIAALEEQLLAQRLTQ